MGGVIWGDADLDAITFYDLDPVLFHPTGKNTSDRDLIVAFYFHGSATQYPGDDAFQLDQIISTQWCSFLIISVRFAPPATPVPIFQLGWSAGLSEGNTLAPPARRQWRVGHNWNCGMMEYWVFYLKDCHSSPCKTTYSILSLYLAYVNKPEDYFN